MVRRRSSQRSSCGSAVPAPAWRGMRVALVPPAFLAFSDRPSAAAALQIAASLAVETYSAQGQFFYPIVAATMATAKLCGENGVKRVLVLALAASVVIGPVG